MLSASWLHPVLTAPLFLRLIPSYSLSYVGAKAVLMQEDQQGVQRAVF